jgi:mRNA-degrading endonuclease RelE of RelBE toxin-antitoxin system
VTYQIRLTRTAKRTLEQMPPRVVEVVVAFIYGPLADNPQRTGKPMQSPYEGLHVGRRGDYRVIYRIQETTVDVQILVIGHRSKIYAFREWLAQAE